jgi:hypothetical protein
MTTETLSGLGFGYLDDRDLNRGVCMWSPDGEWCATPLVAEDYSGLIRGSYAYGARYVLLTDDELLASESFWVCPRHKHEFVEINRNDYEVWQIDVRRNAYLLNPPPTSDFFNVSVKFEVPFGMEGVNVRVMTKSILTKALKEYPDLFGWGRVETEKVSSDG